MNRSRESLYRTYGLTALRLALVAAGVLTVLMQSEGHLPAILGQVSRTQAWWLVMVACGLCLAAATVGTPWQRAGLIAALLLIGSSAQLVVTYSGTFQFIDIRPVSNFSYIPLLTVVLQALVTAAVLMRTRVLFGVFRFLNALGLARTVLLAVLAIGFSVSVMRYVGNKDLPAYLQQLFFAGSFVLLNAATALAVAVYAPASKLSALADRITALISLPGRRQEIRTFDRALPYLAALWVLIVSSLLCIFAFERIPHVIDEAVYVFQSKYFLQGRITAPAPPVAEAFLVTLMDFVRDEWFSIMPPGWPAVLTVGIALNLPWLVNPVLAAACILMAHGVFVKVTDRGTANAIVFLVAISPWFLAMSASKMSHTLTLAAMLAAWWLLLRAREERSFLLAVMAGGSMGLLFLTRYLDGVVLGVLTGLWILTFLKERSRWPIVIGYGLGCIAVGALVFPYNLHLTGDAFLTTLSNYFNEIWHAGVNRFGFGGNIGPGPESTWIGELYPGHSPLEALIHSQHNSHMISLDLFGWVIGSLVFVFAHIIWGRWSRIDLCMAAIIATIIIVFGCFWFSGGFYIGARYWFLTLIPFVVLSVRGAETLVRKLEAVGGAFAATQRLVFVIALLCVFSVVSFLTWRGVEKYSVYRDGHAGYQELVQEHDLEGSLVFVKSGPADDYTNAFVLNSPDLSDPGPIFARDLGPESNRAVAQAFPDRPVYFVAAPSKGESKVRIIKGPVTSSSLR